MASTKILRLSRLLYLPIKQNKLFTIIDLQK
jgi:hypothetical protein